MNFKEKIRQYLQNITLLKVVLVVIGTILIGIGSGMNIKTDLGSSSVGIINGGLNMTFGIPIARAADIVSTILVTLTFIFRRKYVSIGTLIFVLFYGTAVGWGASLYPYFVHDQSIIWLRFVNGIFGLALIYIGSALSINADIGIDPLNGVALTLADKLKTQFRTAKIGLDISLIIIGMLLGGIFGIITVITGFAAGPCIQFLTGKVKNILNNCNKAEQAPTQ